jgi:hypothetical protein
MGFFEGAQTAEMCHDQNFKVCAHALGPLTRRGGAAVTCLRAVRTSAKIEALS